MDDLDANKDNGSIINEKDRCSIESSLTRLPSAKKQLPPPIEVQSNASFYQNAKFNRYSSHSENKDIINENSSVLQSKSKKTNIIPRSKASENSRGDRDMTSRLSNMQKNISSKMNSQSNQTNTIEQHDASKGNNATLISKRHSSFSKGRGKENYLQQNQFREEKKGINSLSQQRRTTEVVHPGGLQEQDTLLANQKQEQLYQISQKYQQKDTIFENNQNKFVRQQAVIAQNKENLEKNLVKLNYIKYVEQEKGVTVIRGLDNKQFYQINKIHNSHNIQQAAKFTKQTNGVASKQLGFLQKSSNNPQRSYQTKHSIMGNNNISYDNHQLLTSFTNQNNIINECQESQVSMESDKCYQNQQQTTIKTSTSQRGKSSKRFNNNQEFIQEEIYSLINPKNSFCGQRNKTEKDEPSLQSKDNDCCQHLGSVSNISFSIALTEQIREKKHKDHSDENKEYFQTEEDEITKREWNKLHFDGNKIQNLPSNIEDEYNRIQKLTEKNEIALQEYVAIRKKIISIQSKNRIVITQFF